MSSRQRSAHAVVSSLACVLAGALLLCVAGAGAAISGPSPLPAGLSPVDRSDLAGCAAAARRFVAAVDAADDSYLEGVLHKEALIALVAEGIPFSEADKAQFTEGMSVMLDRVAQVISASAPGGMDISFRGVLARSSGIHALVRLDLGDMGINYFELKLARTADGRVVIYDWYDYAQGDDYSVNVRNLGALASGDPKVMEVINGVSGIDADTARLTPVFMKQLQQQQLAEAEATWQSMPPQLRYAKPILMQYLKLTAMTGDSSKLQASMAALSEHHGKDPRLALILVDHYFISGDRDGLFRAIDSLKHQMGVEDAGILELEAAYHEGLGESAAAEVSARKAIAAEPDQEDSHWVLVESLLSQHKYPEVTIALQQLRSRFGYEFSTESLSSEPAYAGYLKSQAYHDWMGGTLELPPAARP
jgi:hypothetical protein